MFGEEKNKKYLNVSCDVFIGFYRPNVLLKECVYGGKYLYCLTV